MSYKEILEKYKSLFIILTEKAGEETGIQEYKDVEKILETEKNIEIINEMVESEVDFKIVVSSFIVSILIEIYGPEELETWDEDKSSEHITEFYQLYLKKATIKFCEKYGLERFNNPDMAFKLIVNSKKLLKK